MYLTPCADEQRQQSEVMLTRVLTDNRGNGSCLNKLATSRCPLSAVVMEMATRMRLTGLSADVNWCPRELNRQADALANGDSTGFADEHRVTIDFAGIKWVRERQPQVQEQLGREHADEPSRNT